VNRETRKLRLLRGLCVMCGRRNDRRTQCRTCSECATRQSRIDKRRRARLMAYGRCSRCGKAPFVAGRTLCHGCLIIQRARTTNCRAGGALDDKDDLPCDIERDLSVIPSNCLPCVGLDCPRLVLVGSEYRRWKLDIGMPWCVCEACSVRVAGMGGDE